ncbi:transcriptional regulator [Microbispora cellulosiformans]|uniref:Transcriptional regulator n=1 Tax=Microbispora cellulosiformans TaxID=2614688 RepID=A0A5J5K0K8_9ACTN|nr:transcriptional regulator [Microbispora cellulosiformans]KAA9376398.1 transcriptional regulator [Microbispora cellulosiformans]
MTRDSTPGLLVLHAVRVTGFADTPVLARRYGLDAVTTEEVLRDAEARGWVEHSAFAGAAGWSLTEQGRAENERELAAELARVGAADEVRDVYRRFLPLNGLLLQACTDWQLRPAAGDRLAVNDHSDPAWDAGVLHELACVERALTPLADRLARVLTRFRGYDTRFTAALARARAGDGAWVDQTGLDSCHRVWFELHEDLIATLGLDRGAEP